MFGKKMIWNQFQVVQYVLTLGLAYELRLETSKRRTHQTAYLHNYSLKVLIKGACQHSDIKLVNGYGQNEGRVEIWINSKQGNNDQ